MPTEKETVMIQKATVYDLQKIIDREQKASFTPEEIKALMDAYIVGVQQ